MLEVEFRHGHRLLDPAASGVQRWQVQVAAGGEPVGVLRVARGLFWRTGNLRERLGDESAFLASVAELLFEADGSGSTEFEAAVDLPGNVLVVEELELDHPWTDPVLAAALVSGAIERLSDNGYAVLIPRRDAPVTGAALLHEAGALLAGREFGDGLWLLDTSLAAPEEAAKRVQRLLAERSRNSATTSPGTHEDDEGEGGDGREDWDEDDDGWAPTARTRAVLHLALTDLADAAWAQAAKLGDETVTARAGGVFARLPRLTFHQDASWRRQMARTFDDLAGDLEAGRGLVPGCTGEEMALHLAIRRGRELQRDRPRLVADTVEQLPEDPDDFDWDACSALLFEDHDVLMLFDPALDGVEDPTGPAHQMLGMVDLAPLDWFSPFAPEHTRDPGRGFRAG
ncbi:hypothetical protein [Kitasatospora sp. NPDC088346]|uniref:hypothetical protein n=1 Tax=Kitasatospora sp. NPDC088346 TaxID=3364073 RepID=UPI00382A981C